jgi:Ribbon-helix-helix protein, copG family
MTERPNKLKEQLARVQQAAAPSATSTAAVISGEPVDEIASSQTRRRPRPAGRRRPEAGESWDDRVKRATFYVDRALLDELDQCCERHDLNKSEFVREAITRHLQTYR